MGVEAAAVDEWDVFQYIVGVWTVVVGVWGWRMGRGVSRAPKFDQPESLHTRASSMVAGWN